MRRPLRILLLASPPLLWIGWALVRGPGVATADQPPAPGGTIATGDESRRDEASPAWTTAVTPKPMNANVKKGLAWLVEHQLADGGWSQGEESPNMRGSAGVHETADVADTCVAALALVRAGNTPREGMYKDAVAKAVRYVRAQVEASDTQSLAVSKIQGTRVQMKLGPNIDTFLASLLLAEVKGKMPDEPEDAAVDLALNKVLDKIKKNQKEDGTWDNQRGWAPILAQSIGGKGLNRARQAGAAVSGEMLARTESYAKAQFAQSSVATPTAPAGVVVATAEATPAPVSASRPAGGGSAIGGRPERGSIGAYAGEGSAGVELYARAASIGVLQDSVNTNATLERDLREEVENGKDEPRREKARIELTRIDEAKRVNGQAQVALLGRLDDPQFVAGFGSNGGEEFLSYMNISESLVVKGGPEWKRWDDAMAGNLDRIQNGDGSWSGHHCITGRTFCTSTALLVLLADRTPVPVTPKGNEK